MRAGVNFLFADILIKLKGVLLFSSLLPVPFSQIGIYLRICFRFLVVRLPSCEFYMKCKTFKLFKHLICMKLFTLYYYELQFCVFYSMGFVLFLLVTSSDYWPFMEKVSMMLYLNELNFFCSGCPGLIETLSF